MMKNKILQMNIAMLILVSICCGCTEEKVTVASGDTYISEGQISTENADTTNAETSFEAAEPETIVVYVCGAVERAGIYELTSSARIADALEAAGGFSDEADVSYVNLAEHVTDGQRIYFPKEGEVACRVSSDSERVSMEENVLVDINTADENTLITLPGIGSSRAKQIIEYRNSHGGFSNKEDIKNVSGIGDSIYENLEKYITAN